MKSTIDNLLSKPYLAEIIKKIADEGGEVNISSLLKITKHNYHVLKNKIRELENHGFVSTEERKRYGDKGPKTIVVSLTERGKVVAEQLRNAEKLAKLTPEEIERFKRMRALIHVNVYEDHITIMDIGWEDERVVNIYARPKGDVVYFWCDVDEDTDCYHIQYMFANPKLSDFVRAWIERNGFKLAKIYQKYVDKYWS